MTPETREVLRLFELAHLRYQQALRARIAEVRASTPTKTEGPHPV